VLCGDTNINYSENCKKKKKQQLDAVLQTYNLIGTVSFPMHKTNVSPTAIDNIFTARTKNYTIYPFINGLSDHKAQILVKENVVLKKQRETSTIKVYWNFSYY